MNIHIKDGPHAGRGYNFPAPVPKQIVLAEQVGPMGLKYHDYTKVGYSRHFTHSQGCKCREKPPAVRDLDA